MTFNIVTYRDLLVTKVVTLSAHHLIQSCAFCYSVPSRLRSKCIHIWAKYFWQHRSPKASFGARFAINDANNCLHLDSLLLTNCLQYCHQPFNFLISKSQHAVGESFHSCAQKRMQWIAYTSVAGNRSGCAFTTFVTESAQILASEWLCAHAKMWRVPRRGCPQAVPIPVYPFSFSSRFSDHRRQLSWFTSVTFRSLIVTSLPRSCVPVCHRIVFTSCSRNLSFASLSPAFRYSKVLRTIWNLHSVKPHSPCTPVTTMAQFVHFSFTIMGPYLSMSASGTHRFVPINCSLPCHVEPLFGDVRKRYPSPHTQRSTTVSDAESNRLRLFSSCFYAIVATLNRLCSRCSLIIANKPVFSLVFVDDIVSIYVSAGGRA